MRLIARSVIVLCFAAIATSTVRAAPPAPDVKRIFPAGGQAGQQVEIKVDGNLAKTTAQCWTSHSGLSVRATDKPDHFTVSIAPNTVPGRHWLRFFNNRGAAELRPFIVGYLPEIAETEPNDGASQAQVMSEQSVVVNGALSKGGEVDTFAVSLKAGQTLVAAMTAHQFLNSPMDCVLQLLDQSGFVLYQNDDHQGNDPRIVFTPTTDGTFYVRTFAFPAAPNSTIAFSGSAAYVYRLTLTTGPYIDHTLPMALSTTAEPAVQLKGWNIPDELTNAVPSVDIERRMARVFNPRTANSLSLPLTDNKSYAESITWKADQTAGRKIELPSSVTGLIDAPDQVDRYTFDGIAGQKVVFQVAARSFFSTLDPIARLLGPDGKQLSEADDINRTDLDSKLEFTIRNDGLHTIEIRDRFQHFSPQHVYRLTSTLPQPDFRLTTDKTSWTVQPGKPLKITVSVQRLESFSEEIEVRLESNSTVIAAAPVVSQPKGDSAKSVKLKITATAGLPFGQPIRIVGQSRGDTKKSQTMTAAIGGTTTSDLWLTVLPATPLEAKRSAGDNK